MRARVGPDPARASKIRRGSARTGPRTVYKDQLNLPENHAGKPVKVVDSDSLSKQSENVAPLVAGKSLAGEAAPGVPMFTFSKTSFSAMWVLSFSTSDHLYLTGQTRNLFGQEYCQGRKRVSRKEVKEAFETLTEEKIAVCFQFIFFRNSYSNIFSILSGIRVVHSWHFWSIFHSFFIPFCFHFFSKLKLRMNEKWIKNGTLTMLLQKWTRKMIIL